jgi:hypothetical protein
VKVGITGSRLGATEAQTEVLIETLSYLREAYGAEELHHGDAVGVDAQAAAIARDLGYRTIGHPPDVDLYRAFFPSDEDRPPMDYLLRDRAVVQEVDVLIGCPNTRRPVRRSGTWYTIRYAIRVNQRLMVIWPDGSVSTS